MKRKILFLAMVLALILSLTLLGACESDAGSLIPGKTPSDNGEKVDDDVVNNYSVAIDDYVSSSVKEYKAGESITLSARDIPDKYFVGWFYQGELVTGKEISFTVEEDVVVRAYYVDAYTIYLDPGDGEFPKGEGEDRFGGNWKGERYAFAFDGRGGITVTENTEYSIAEDGNALFKLDSSGKQVVCTKNGNKLSVVYEDGKAFYRSEFEKEKGSDGIVGTWKSDNYLLVFDGRGRVRFSETAYYEIIADKAEVELASTGKKLVCDIPQQGILSVKFDDGRDFYENILDEDKVVDVVVGAGLDYVLPVPVKKNYDFIRWELSPTEVTNEKGESLSGFSFATDVTLSAVYKERPKFRYTVTNGHIVPLHGQALPDYSTQEGPDGSTVYYLYRGDEVAFQCETLTEQGKMFTKWVLTAYDGDDNSLDPYTDSDETVSFTVNGHMTLTASYIEAYYINIWIGSSAMPAQICKKNEEINVKVGTAPIGQRFLKWVDDTKQKDLVNKNTLADGEEPSPYSWNENGDLTFTVSESVSIRAVFENIKYKLKYEVSYEIDGQTYVYEEHEESYSYNQTITMWIPDKDEVHTWVSEDASEDFKENVEKCSKHMHFNRWDSDYSRMPAQDVIVKGKMVYNVYKYSIINGNSTTEHEKEYGEVTVKADDVIGKKFLNWTINGVELAHNDTESTFLLDKEIVVKANYDWIYYWVRFKLSGATYGEETVYEYQKHYGEDVYIPAKVELEHYKFYGWNYTLNDNKLTGNDITVSMPAEDFILKGNYVADTHEVSIGGGHFLNETETKLKLDWGSTITVVPDLQTGYEFSAWKINGIAIEPTDARVVAIDENEQGKYTIKVLGDMTLEPASQKKTYEIVYYLKDIQEDGSEESSKYYSAKVKYDDVFPSPAQTPSASYKTFSGWTYNDNGVDKSLPERVGDFDGEFKVYGTLDWTYFEIDIPYAEVSATNGSQAYINPANQREMYKYNTELSIKATFIGTEEEKQWYEFDYWADGNEQKLTDKTEEEILITINSEHIVRKVFTLTHEFKKKTFTAKYYMVQDGITTDYKTDDTSVTVSFDIDTAISALRIPAKVIQHYDFKDWKIKKPSSAENTQPEYADIPAAVFNDLYEFIDKNDCVNIYGTYNRHVYKVKLNYKNTDTGYTDESKERIIDVTYGNEFELKAEYTIDIEGWTMLHWEQENGDVVTVGTKFTVEVDRSLTAVYQDTRIRVTLVGGCTTELRDGEYIGEENGSDNTVVRIYRYGSSITVKLPNPMPTGYELDGWKKDDVELDKNDPPSFIQVNNLKSDTKYEVLLRLKSYKVVYYIEGTVIKDGQKISYDRTKIDENLFKNELGEGNPNNYTVKHFDTITVYDLLQAPEHYEFDGWYTNISRPIESKVNPGDELEVSRTINLYGIFLYRNYDVTINYVNEEGEVLKENAKGTGKYRYNNSVVLTVDTNLPELRGRELQCWKLQDFTGTEIVQNNGEYSIKIEDEVMVNEKITVVAVFSWKNYNLIFNVVGGAYGISESEYTRVEYHYGETVELIAQPPFNVGEADRYYFKGWFKDDAPITDEIIMPDEDVTILGKFGDKFTYILGLDGFYGIKLNEDFADWLEGCDSEEVAKLCGEVKLPSLYKSQEIRNILQNGFRYSKYTSVTLPSTVVSIGNYAFADSDLETIVLSDNVETIGESAFKNCKIAEFVLPQYVTSVGKEILVNTAVEKLVMKSTPCTVGYLFGATTNLNQGDFIPNSLFTVEFSDCDIRAYAMTNIRVPQLELKSVYSIGDYAFSGCSGINMLTIPSTVESIGNYAFSGLSAVTKVTFRCQADSYGIHIFNDIGSSLTAGTTFEFGPASNGTVPSNLFDGRNDTFNITKITLNNRVTGIEKDAFKGMTSLASVTLPSTLEFIGSNAFEGTGLTEITIPASVTQIGEQAFRTTGKLKKINYNAVSASASEAFYGAGKGEDTSLIIGNNVTSIGDSTFAYSNISTVTISKSVKSIGEKAFYFCDYLSTINFNAEMNDGSFIGSSTGRYFSGGYGNGDVGKTVNIGSQVTVVPSYIFYEANVSSIVFGENSACDTVKNSAFGGNKISSLALGYNIVTLESDAFTGIVDGTSFELPYSVRYISSRAFIGNNNAFDVNCQYTTSFTTWQSGWTNGNVHYDAAEKFTYGDYLYIVSGNKAYITSFTGSVADIPTSIAGYDVYGFGETFRNNPDVTQITVNNANISFLVRYSFAGSENLQSVEINMPVEELEKGLCQGCTNLTSAVIPFIDGYIPESTFEGCSSLGEFDFGESGITAIGDYAFKDSGLTEICVTGVTSVGEEAFARCVQLESIISNGAQTDYFVLDGIVYVCTVADSTKNSLEFGSEVVEISAYAMYGAQYITAVTLPEELTAVKGYAFAGSENLVNVYINSQQISNFANTAFANAGSAGITITFGQTVSVIPENVFAGNQNITNVSFPTTGSLTVGRYAFADTGITSLTIAESVTDIEDGAFGNIVGLSTVTINSESDFSGSAIFDGSGDSNTLFVFGKHVSANLFREKTVARRFDFTDVESIGRYAFYKNGTVTEVILPSVKEIGERAFGETSLSSIQFPSSIETIGRYAFNGISGLTEVSFDSGCDAFVSVGEFAFAGATLSSIEFPASTETIGDSAFAYMTSLQSISFGTDSSLVTIGNNAFRGVSVTEIVIPENVKTLGDFAFGDIDGIESIYYNAIAADDLVRKNGVFAATDSYDGTVKIEVYIGADVVSVPAYLFAPYYEANSNPNNTDYDKDKVAAQDLSETKFSRISKVEFASGNAIEAVGRMAFGNLASAQFVGIPASTFTFIGDMAFYNCLTIAEIEAGEMTELGVGAFENCANLSSFTVDENSSVVIGDKAFFGAVLLETVVIGKATSIGNSAFDGCTDAFKNYISSSVSPLPDTLTYIGDRAFYGCDDLKSLNIGNKVKYIGKEAFYGCVNVAEIFFNPTFDTELMQIGEGRISNAERTRFENYAAFGLVGIGVPSGAGLTIGADVEVIPAYFFAKTYGANDEEYAVNIKDIGFVQRNATLKTLKIRDSAFAEMEISELVIPYFVSEVRENAFKGCAMMLSLYIGSDVDKTEVNDGDALMFIGEEAFSYLSALEYVYYYSAAVFPEKMFMGTQSSGDDINYVSGRIFMLSGKTAQSEGDTEGFKLVIGKRVPAINAYMFYSNGFAKDAAPKVRELAIDDDSVLCTIGEMAFYGNDYLKTINLPKGITYIGKSAFEDSANLTSITAASNLWELKEIGENAFKDNTSLISISAMSALETIGRYAFGNTKLTAFNLSDTVKNIGAYAFANTALTSIYLGGGIISISEYAFSGITTLRNVTANIKSDLAYCEKDAFAGSGSATNTIKLFVVNTANYLPRLFYCSSGSEPYVKEIEISNEPFVHTDDRGEIVSEEEPEPVEIAGRAFTGLPHLTAFAIPRKVANVGESAFEGLPFSFSIRLQRNAAIGKAAFKNSGLNYLYMYTAGESSIGEEAFYGCTSFITVKDIESGSNTVAVYIAQGQTYSNDYWDYDKNRLLSLPVGRVMSTIGARAFYDCTSFNFTEVIPYPETVGEQAFYNCHVLQNMYVSFNPPGFALCDEQGKWYKYRLFKSETAEVALMSQLYSDDAVTNTPFDSEYDKDNVNRLTGTDFIPIITYKSKEAARDNGVVVGWTYYFEVGYHDINTITFEEVE